MARDDLLQQRAGAGGQHALRGLGQRGPLDVGLFDGCCVAGVTRGLSSGGLALCRRDERPRPIDFLDRLDQQNGAQHFFSHGSRERIG